MRMKATVPPEGEGEKAGGEGAGGDAANEGGAAGEVEEEKKQLRTTENLSVERILRGLGKSI